MAERVRLTAVSKSFGGTGRTASTRPVLDGIELTVAAGEMIALLGASGCGKSTLLRLVAGLERPTTGEVRLGDRVVADVDPRCAVVFQEPRLLPWRTIAGNVALGARRGTGSSPGAMLARVGLAGAERAYPHQLSGGMAQRAALARALIGRPRVLLLDEPFASLDALTRLQMQDLLVEVCRDARPTVLLVTHDVDEALRLADRVVLLAAPRPSAAASVAATFAVPRPTPRDATGGRDDAAQATAIANLRAEILGYFGLGPPPAEGSVVDLAAD